MMVAGDLRVDRRRTGVRANRALGRLTGRRLRLTAEVRMRVRLVSVVKAVAGELAFELVHRDGREDGRLVDDGSPIGQSESKFTSQRPSRRERQKPKQAEDSLVNLLMDRDDVVND